MPISIIAGAQYGSEGKGKVAYEWALRRHADAVVRVGGPNSGHTVVLPSGEVRVFRQLPTAALLEDTVSVLVPGSYLNLDVLRREMDSVGATPESVWVDPRAVVVTAEDIESEERGSLRGRIGSTASGTGHALQRRVSRDGSTMRAADVEWLRPFLRDTLPGLERLARHGRVLIEGTQGYGLSLLHGLEGEFATSRDTTAAGFLSEAGLSPLDVDEVVLVARAFPIRVAGNSGRLAHETDWNDIGQRAGIDGLTELTTVTQRVRRVGEFDAGIVVRAIQANRPTHLVMNHVDYLGQLDTDLGMEQARAFIADAESEMGRRIDLIGVSRDRLVSPNLVVRQ